MADAYLNTLKRIAELKPELLPAFLAEAIARAGGAAAVGLHPRPPRPTFAQAIDAGDYVSPHPLASDSVLDDWVRYTQKTATSYAYVIAFGAGERDSPEYTAAWITECRWHDERATELLTVAERSLAVGPLGPRSRPSSFA